MKKKSTALEKVQVFVDCENVPGKPYILTFAIRASWSVCEKLILRS